MKLITTGPCLRNIGLPHGLTATIDDERRYQLRDEKRMKYHYKGQWFLKSEFPGDIKSLQKTFISYEGPVGRVAPVFRYQNDDNEIGFWGLFIQDGYEIKEELKILGFKFNGYNSGIIGQHDSWYIRLVSDEQLEQILLKLKMYKISNK